MLINWIELNKYLLGLPVPFFRIVAEYPQEASIKGIGAAVILRKRPVRGRLFQIEAILVPVIVLQDQGASILNILSCFVTDYNSHPV